jgi:hypothetical protein
MTDRLGTVFRSGSRIGRMVSGTARVIRNPDDQFQSGIKDPVAGQLMP